MTPTKPEMLEFLGLARDPFAKLREAGDVWPSVTLRSARHLVDYALSHSEMVAMLGGFGVGKTTLLHAALESVEQGPGETIAIHVAGSKDTLRISAVVEEMLRGLGNDRLPQSETARRRMLKAALVGAFGQDKRIVLVIDEAHRMKGITLKALKELHEQSRHAWREATFAILLAGHRQLTALAHFEARDFLARLESHNILHLSALSAGEAAMYICHRLDAAGAPQLLEMDTLELLARRGTPLEINRTMWRIFEAAYLKNVKPITPELVRAVLPTPPAPPDASAGNIDDLLKGLSEPNGGRDAASSNIRTAHGE